MPKVQSTLCGPETPKLELCQTVKTQMNCHIMQHFIGVYTVCKDKIDLQRVLKKYNGLEIITCDPSIYTMDYPNLTTSNFMGNSIGTQRVKKITWHLSGVTDREMNLGAHTFMNISIYRLY